LEVEVVQNSMASFEDYSSSLEEFAGTVRLFPLPNLVLFPHVMQPLHIFEPRYRDLFEAALAGDGLIAMALLAPGWESDYEGRPPLYPVACLGRIAAHHRLDDGSFNVLLVGMRRVRLLEELAPANSYREARVELLQDVAPSTESGRRTELRKRLRREFLRILPNLPQAEDQLDQLLAGDVSLSTLTDIISYMLDIELAQKQALLAELNVRRRAESLLDQVATAVAATPSRSVAGPFPPEIGLN
jgi:Lon protease-like protein